MVVWRLPPQGHRFQFDELVRVAEYGYAEECAGCVMGAEGRTDLFPCGHEIGACGGRHVDRRLEYVGDAGSAGGQGLAKVEDTSSRLKPDVTDADNRPVLVQRACAGGVYQRARRSSSCVRVWGIEEAGHADEFNTHDPKMPDRSRSRRVSLAYGASQPMLPAVPRHAVVGHYQADMAMPRSARRGRCAPQL
jgi:hypothetical protein